VATGVGVVVVVELVVLSVPVVELSEMTAKSIRPEFGLKITSLIVPTV
jgi:hypothetical protein